MQFFLRLDVYLLRISLLGARSESYQGAAMLPLHCHKLYFWHKINSTDITPHSSVYCVIDKCCLVFIFYIAIRLQAT